MRFDRIKKILEKEFKDALVLKLEDLSHQHAGRAGTESHFKLKLVSESFDGMARVQRQRRLNQLLAGEFESGLHALTMRLSTPEEEARSQSHFSVPPCRGKE